MDDGCRWNQRSKTKDRAGVVNSCQHHRDTKSKEITSTMSDKKTSVLVVGATGRIGVELCKALTITSSNENNKFDVFGTTRKTPSSKLEQMGVTAVQFAFGDTASMENAIKTSKATVVYFVTDFFVAAGGKPDVEIEHGKIIVDACKACGVQHAIFSSVADCDVCPEGVEHFKTKVEVEDYLKASGLNYSILRPVAFFENLDDPSNYNPLKKGSVKALWPVNLHVKMVSCVDIGKAAKVVIDHPEQWKGKTLDCVSCNVTGDVIAQALSKASGVRCTYSMAVPKFVQKLFMKDLYYMVRFFEDQGYTSSIEDFKKVVPDAMGPLEFFQYKGKWSNGEAFAPRGDGGIVEQSSSVSTYLLYASAAVGLMAVYASVTRTKTG
jgi:uncharacterized protein YbjT (DUF2867 family)